MKYAKEKLIRDKIPQIIAASAQKKQIRVATSSAQYWLLLKNKLQEEVNEFIESEEIEELADIMQVINEICRSKKVSIRVIEKMRKDKLRKRGGFKKKLVLGYD